MSGVLMMTTDIEGFVLRGGDSWQSPWSSYRWLRDNDPVHRVDHPLLGRFWVLSRFGDVIDAARDTATFSSAQGLTPGPDSGVMFEDGTRPIVMMDPPDHTSMRRLVSRPMTPRMVSPIEPAVRAFVRERLDDAPAESEIDIVELLFKPLPSFVVAHYLGVPPDDRIRFDAWTDSIVAANADANLESAADAFLGLFAFGSELIERRKAQPGDDLVSLLVQAGEGAVSAGWIVGFVFTMVTGGNDTTTGLLGGAAALLTERLDQRRLLLDDPALIPGAVEELLRLTSPVQNLARTATADVRLHGTTIPAGDKVMLLYGSANRDERVFGADAGELDVRRRIDRMVSFGYGAHHCLGAAAARLQAVVVLEELLARFPDFAVDAEAGRFASGAYVRRYESLPFRGPRMNVGNAGGVGKPTGFATGEDLYRIVCEYAALGHHRSGTDRDAATTEWFVELMSDLGDVTTAPVEFDRYEASSELTVDGRPLEHLPLHYEFTGKVDTSDVAVRRFDPLGGGFPDVANNLIEETRREGHEALVICTDQPDGELVAINRELHASPSGLPTVLVAGCHYDTLASSAVRLRLGAGLVAGRTANIEVSSDQPGRRMVLTTPLNGWFSAAGERGTGIAVLRHVAERLTDRPLTVVATGGHELGYMGAYAWVDRCTEPPVGIAHIGASLAVETAVRGGRQLIDSRIAMTTLGESTARGVTEALDDAGITLRCDSDTWLGEGEAWSLLGVPVLSTTGAGPDFHTPSDTPERATSPGALATVADAVHRAVADFYDASTVCS